MHATPELVTLLLLERDREAERARLARVAGCLQHECSASLVGRLARALRAQAATCRDGE